MRLKKTLIFTVQKTIKMMTIYSENKLTGIIIEGNTKILKMSENLKLQSVIWPKLQSFKLWIVMQHKPQCLQEQDVRNSVH